MFKRKKENSSYSYFAPGVVLQGRLRFQGAIRLDGAVEGEICSPGLLVAEESAVIRGDIFVESVVLSGTVYGNIQASKQVHLTVTAKVYGNISYGELAIDVGAMHEGSCHKLSPEEIAELAEKQKSPDASEKSEAPKELSAPLPTPILLAENEA